MALQRLRKNAFLKLGDLEKRSKSRRIKRQLRNIRRIVAPAKPLSRSEKILRGFRRKRAAANVLEKGAIISLYAGIGSIKFPSLFASYGLTVPLAVSSVKIRRDIIKSAISRPALASKLALQAKDFESRFLLNNLALVGHLPEYRKKKLAKLLDSLFSIPIMGIKEKRLKAQTAVFKELFEDYKRYRLKHPMLMLAADELYKAIERQGKTGHETAAIALSDIPRNLHRLEGTHIPDGPGMINIEITNGPVKKITLLSTPEGYKAITEDRTQN